MQVTTQLLSREHEHDHEHDESCEHGHDHSHANVRLPVMIAGLAFVANGFFIEWAGKFGLLDGYLTSIRVNEISAAIGALILGTPIVWTALKDARLGRLSTNELVAIAVMASFASGHYYEAGVVSFFMLLGEIIETKTAAGARESIAQLIKLTPTRANRITNDNGGEEEVAVSALQVGDRIRVRPGDNVAADGVILSGSGAINEANVTGESLPRDKEAGDEVFQGTVNTTGVLEVRVTKAGQDTTFSRLQRMILDAERSKLPLMKIVDQYMGFYTPLVLVIGASGGCGTAGIQLARAMGAAEVVAAVVGRAAQTKPGRSWIAATRLQPRRNPRTRPRRPTGENCLLSTPLPIIFVRRRERPPWVIYTLSAKTKTINGGSTSSFFRSSSPKAPRRCSSVSHILASWWR